MLFRNICFYHFLFFGLFLIYMDLMVVSLLGPQMGPPRGAHGGPWELLGDPYIYIYIYRERYILRFVFVFTFSFLHLYFQCVYIYIYIYMYTHIFIHLFIYIWGTHGGGGSYDTGETTQNNETTHSRQGVSRGGALMARGKIKQ